MEPQRLSKPSFEATSLPASGASGINPLNVIRILRSAGSALLAQAALHGQLARVEWAQEKTRLSKMFVAGLLGFACLLCVMVFGGALVLALSWDTVYRVAAVLAVIVVYAIGLGIAWHYLQTLSERSGQAFAATREEIAADIALLKSKL